ncbi:hypothetical protein DACRYDRAFT_24395 [Dacryopinax primogenitus]|uniref:DUF1772-domain-containing protein n=1 Tax=Dacryopinax primogenitus (strain DJM 731) TaxID=1858805 RepID=M5FRK4_DACPD|nr:uncharacterized protein DACRYDRAFT_24395 [Dacryopinax primogenitus]EJT98333.1 hypothetical protein DACRYDRAFT_24395 [Dacryopinax primogenitus]
MSDRATTVVKALAVGSASYLAGYITAFSLSIPAVALSPATLAAQQWRNLFHTGMHTAPPIAAFAAAGFAFLSFSEGHTTLRGRVYAAAGALTLSIVPYTLGLMRQTNGRLLECAERKELTEDEVAREEGRACREEREESEVHSLLEKWRKLNFGRALAPTLGAALGWWAVLGW